QGVLAKVGNQEIGIPEVAQQARLIGKQQFKGNIPPTLMPFLMQRAAQGVIAQKMLLYEADRMGLGVSNDELRRLCTRVSWASTCFPGATSSATRPTKNLSRAS